MYTSFLIPTLLLALSAALSGLFTWPRWSTPTGASEFAEKSVAELKADEAVYADAFGKMREIELARTGLAAKYNAVSEADRGRLEKFLPGHPDAVRIVLDLENIARLHKLKLRSVSAAAPTAARPGARVREESGYEPLVFAFSAVGSYDAFVPFLADLEASIRLADITEVSFESKEGSEYVYGVTLRTYQLAETEERTP